MFNPVKYDFMFRPKTYKNLIYFYDFFFFNSSSFFSEWVWCQLQINVEVLTEWDLSIYGMSEQQTWTNKKL